ncbi:thiamine-phosphate diphosphorylase [Selenomonas sp. GACV-9]|uniref:thiamine phosphate synthase n=1 Tax=Selenomonas sp. GACV-9 TaxID=3158782 RepID=UPI0008E86B34|nr:thiamine-phosphate diphosphorylase [Selenomonas ruminantium]
MSIRDDLDVSAYLIIGPENTKGRPVADIVRLAVAQGFTCVQIRSKTASARELIALCDASAQVIAELGQSGKTALLVDDRLDVAWAARQAGIAVDGIHVGQKDIPAAACRNLLGPEAIVGLSARPYELIDYVLHLDTSDIDYFGAGPLHPTASKPDAGMTADGQRHTRSFAELTELHRISPIPVVVGGGVKAADLPELKRTGVEGFFVISAIAGADDPAKAAAEMVNIWRQ